MFAIAVAGAALGAALTGQASAQAAPPAPAAPAASAAPAAPDSAAAEDGPGRELLEAIGSGDEARIRAFLGSAFHPEAARMEPTETTVARTLALARQSGGVDVAEWEPREDRIFFAGTTRRGRVPVQGMIGLRDGRIMGYQMDRDVSARGADAPPWPPAVTNPVAAIEAIRAEIDWRARNELFSGTVLIAHRGQPVIDGAWGLARRSPDLANSPDTMFHTASTTKMLTSAAVARLIDRGRLSLDMSVADAVPALRTAPGAAETRLRDLLGHRVSYGEYFTEREQDPLIGSHARATELLRLIEGRAPERAPEGQIAYSNANYLVLAAAIEAATGRSYYDFVRDELLRPLALERTSFGSPDGRPQGAAIGWIRDEVSDPLGLEAFRSNDGRGGFRGGPAGGAWSTARDLWRFVDAVAAGRVIRPPTLEAMLGDRVRVGPALGSALGFMFRGREGLDFFGHAGGGGNAGMSTAAFITPDREWAVVVLSNFSSPAGEMLASQIMDLLARLPRQGAEAP